MTDSERLRELTETGSSVRYTGRPIMTMIAEALGPVCPRCNRDHEDPQYCADGRSWGPFDAATIPNRPTEG